METTTSTHGEAMGTNSEDAPISCQIIDAVADAKGVDPLDLPPLYDTVDPDALDSLFSHAGAGGAVTDLRIEIADCEVLVRGSGDVVIVRSDADVAPSEPVEQPDAAGDRCGIDVGGDAPSETQYD